VVANTKHYLPDKVYRFMPAFIGKNATKRFHGINERISVNNFVQIVEFYHRRIIHADFSVNESWDRPAGGSGHYNTQGRGNDESEIKDNITDDYKLVEDSI
jgi:hypothetical protein